MKLMAFSMMAYVFLFWLQTVKLCFIIDIFMGPHNHVICF